MGFDRASICGDLGVRTCYLLSSFLSSVLTSAALPPIFPSHLLSSSPFLFCYCICPFLSFPSSFHLSSHLSFSPLLSTFSSFSVFLFFPPLLLSSPPFHFPMQSSPPTLFLRQFDKDNLCHPAVITHTHTNTHMQRHVQMLPLHHTHSEYLTSNCDECMTSDLQSSWCQIWKQVQL